MAKVANTIDTMQDANTSSMAAAAAAGPGMDEIGKLKDIKVVTNNDVLNGRGGAAHRHPGNLLYRNLVNLNKRPYATCLKSEKLKISKSIVAAIREERGRFLEQDKSTGLWSDIGDKRAVEKTSQALRENQPKLKKQIMDLEKTAGTTPPQTANGAAVAAELTASGTSTNTTKSSSSSASSSTSATEHPFVPPNGGVAGGDDRMQIEYAPKRPGPQGDTSSERFASHLLNQLSLGKLCESNEPDIDHAAYQKQQQQQGHVPHRQQNPLAYSAPQPLCVGTATGLGGGNDGAAEAAEARRMMNAQYHYDREQGPHHPHNPYYASAPAEVFNKQFAVDGEEVVLPALGAPSARPSIGGAMEWVNTMYQPDSMVMGRHDPGDLLTSTRHLENMGMLPEPSPLARPGGSSAAENIVLPGLGKAGGADAPPAAAGAVGPGNPFQQKRSSAVESESGVSTQTQNSASSQYVQDLIVSESQLSIMTGFSEMSSASFMTPEQIQKCKRACGDVDMADIFKSTSTTSSAGGGAHQQLQQHQHQHHHQHLPVPSTVDRGTSSGETSTGTSLSSGSASRPDRRRVFARSKYQRPPSARHQQQTAITGQTSIRSLRDAQQSSRTQNSSAVMDGMPDVHMVASNLSLLSDVSNLESARMMLSSPQASMWSLRSGAGAGTSYQPPPSTSVLAAGAAGAAPSAQQQQPSGTQLAGQIWEEPDNTNDYNDAKEGSEGAP